METNTNFACLEMHVYGVDGHVAAFAQKDAELANRLIQQIQSGRIFTLPSLMIAGQHSFTVFPTFQVVRVDLVMRGFPDWPFHRGIQDVAEVTEEEFRMRIAAASQAPTRQEGLHAVCAEIEMTNGERLYMKFHVHFTEETLTRVDFGLLIQHLLTSPAFHARRLGGGVIVLNPAHLLRVQLYPPSAQPPANAWIADPITKTAERDQIPLYHSQWLGQ